MKQWVWSHWVDPVLRRVASRLEHLAQQRAATLDGEAWQSIAVVGKDVTLHRDALLINNGPRESVRIGERCRLYGQIWMFGDGRLSIGHHSFIGAGSRIWCNSEVRIGSHVLISHLVDIHDTSAHSLDWRLRRDEIHRRFDHDDHAVPPGVLTAPIVIEDDVWIGFKATVLKGVTLGRGCVVAAASVVTKDVAPFTLVAGNPARVVRELPQ